MSGPRSDYEPRALAELVIIRECHAAYYIYIYIYIYISIYQYIGPKGPPGFLGKARCGSGTGALHGGTGPCVLSKLMFFVGIAFLA